MFKKLKKNQSSEKDLNIQPFPDRETISPSEYASLSAEERSNWAPVNPKYERVSLFAIISFSIAAVCLILYILICVNQNFADFFNIHISSVFRTAFAYISGILPFSIAEMAIILLPLIFVLLIRYILKNRCMTWKTTWISVINLVAVLSILLSTFVLNFAAGYKGSSLEDKLGLEQKEIGAQELYDAAVYLADMAAKEAESLNIDTSGSSVMPYGFDEMNKKLIEAYDSFCKDYDFINNFSSKLKPVMLSDAMSYTHITGVYSFFTGEANVNIAFPDYTIPYTAAHELAHQRGIAREDEANMIAFLVCIRSDDKYIRYSAYLNIYEYVANALYSADKELYYEARAHLNDEIISEQAAYNKFFEKYRHSVSSKVSNTVNDTYLKLQGTEGSKSYGMVVDLTVAYLKSENIIN